MTRSHSVRPALALAGATAKSLRNTLGQLFRRAPVLTSAALLLLLICGLAMVAFQLQAITPLIHERTLTSLEQLQLKDVSRASLTGMAASAWGVTLILDIVGLQPAGVRVLAVSKGVGRWNRALGELLPPYVLAMTVALFLVGPVTVLSLARVQTTGGSGLGASFVAALAFTALTGLIATITPLAIQALTALVLRSSNDALGVKSVSASACGVLLIAGISLVLAGRTSGLYVLCPPLAVTGGIPDSLSDAALVLLASVLWGLLCAYALSFAGTSGRNSDHGAPWRLAFVRLPGRSAGIEARQMLRDPLFIAATSVSLAAAAALAVLFHTGHLQEATASLVLLVLCGITSLITGLAPFRLAETAWLHAVHPRGFSRWARHNALGALAAGLLTVIFIRVASLLPLEPGRDAVIVCMALAASAMSVLFGLATVNSDFSEKRVALLGSGLLSGGTLGALFWLSSTAGALSTAAATAAYWLVVAVLAHLATQEVMCVKDRNFARSAEQ
ncbi:hypothetical protein [Streptomyces sp. NPDC047974]|uniref:hypothetical protein n=1 Tax=Streptomyces sp. NPDC047974 TaxID=3154343 RepID=UPI0033DF6485